MKNKIANISLQINTFEINDSTQLETFRIQFLGSKSEIKSLFGELKSAPNEDKKSIGKELNDLRIQAEEKYATFKENLENTTTTKESIDFSRPGEHFTVGSHHPISLVRREIIEIFNRIGFAIKSIKNSWVSSEIQLRSKARSAIDEILHRVLCLKKTAGFSIEFSQIS